MICIALSPYFSPICDDYLILCIFHDLETRAVYWTVLLKFVLLIRFAWRFLLIGIRVSVLARILHKEYILSASYQELSMPTFLITWKEMNMAIETFSVKKSWTKIFKGATLSTLSSWPYAVFIRNSLLLSETTCVSGWFSDFSYIYSLQPNREYWKNKLRSLLDDKCFSGGQWQLGC